MGCSVDDAEHRLQNAARAASATGIPAARVTAVSQEPLVQSGAVGDLVTAAAAHYRCSNRSGGLVQDQEVQRPAYRPRPAHCPDVVPWSQRDAGRIALAG